MNDFRAEASRLLLWLNAQTAGDIDVIVDVDVEGEPDWQHVSEPQVVALLQDLQHRGLVNTHRTFASGTATRITPAGIAAAERYAQERDSPARRFDYAANWLVSAAMDNYPSTRVKVSALVGSRRMWFYDRVLELDEVDRAITYLEQNSLASVERTAAQAVTFSLTPRGTECGFRDPISVRTFLSEQQHPPQSVVHNTFQGPINAMQIGDSNTQNNTFGFDPDKLAGFAQQVLAAATQMEVPSAVRQLIADDAAALQREAEREEPQPSRVRAAWATLKNSLLQAGSDQAATKLLELGSSMLG
ncbi:hypothetical protein ACFV5J_11125 [Streptomyces zaomyceticus]|uniref:hypothetical protein n=1 Tax=Streptomyces zaomyceticus TaxID=68286 RepID=UPI003659EF15